MKAKQGIVPITTLSAAGPRNTSLAEMDVQVQAIIDGKAEKNEDGSVKEIMVPLNLIRRQEVGAFDVRVESRNPEKVKEFAGQFKEDPSRIPPIFLEYRETPDGEMYFINAEGRHREDGANLAGMKEIRAIIFYGLTFQERRTLGMHGNMGGPLPMSQRDFKMNVLELLKKECIKRPADKLLLKSALNKIRILLAGKKAKDEIEAIIRWAARDYANVLLNNANAEVTRGDMTVREAAKKWGVAFTRLQKKRDKTAGGGRENDPTKLSGHIGKEFKDFRKKLDTMVGNLIHDQQKGIYWIEEVYEFFQQMRRLTNEHTERIKEGEIKLRALQYGD